eukprot:jgi/Galph1/5298/GphlegSOOS_G3915.1
MSVDSGSNDPEHTVLGMKLLEIKDDPGDHSQQLHEVPSKDSYAHFPKSDSPFLSDEARRKLELMRSSSAPPSLFVSSFDLFGLNKAGEDDASLETVYEGVRPDDPRLDPLYFEYYYTQKRNDPRLPKPLLSYTDFKIASETNGKVYSKEFLNDLKAASVIDESEREVSDLTEDASATDTLSRIKQPQPVLAKRISGLGPFRPSTPRTSGEKTSSRSGIDLSSLQGTLSTSSDSAQTSPPANSLWPKSNPGRFPRTPSPALATNASRRTSNASPRQPIERVRSFGDIGTAETPVSLAPGTPPPTLTEGSKQPDEYSNTIRTERNSGLDINVYEATSLTSGSATDSVWQPSKEVSRNFQPNTSNDKASGMASRPSLSSVEIPSIGPMAGMPNYREFVSDQRTRNATTRMPSQPTDWDSSRTPMGPSYYGKYSPFYSEYRPMGAAEQPHGLNSNYNTVTDISYGFPGSSYFNQPAPLYAAQVAQFAAYNAAAVNSIPTSVSAKNPFYPSPSLSGQAFPGRPSSLISNVVATSSPITGNNGPWETDSGSFSIGSSNSYRANSSLADRDYLKSDLKIPYPPYMNSFNRNSGETFSPSGTTQTSPPNKRGGKSKRGGRIKGEPEIMPKDKINGTEMKRSRLLEEFRQTCLVGRPSSNAQPTTQLYPSTFVSVSVRNWELSDIMGHVAEFSSDQHGSRFIQQKLETASMAEIRALVSELDPDVDRLVVDVFGNYVVQKLLDYGDEYTRESLTRKLKGHMLSLSLHMYGCRVVQKSVEVLKGTDRMELVCELDGHVLQCIRDQNGNHVIQKCIELVEPESVVFIIDAVKGQAVILAEHAYGCRVVQRILEHSPWEQKKEILQEIMASARDLVRDQYGNYVIQHIVERGDEVNKSHIMKVVLNEVVAFAQHKFASNVVERCLQYGSPVQRIEFIEVLLRGDDSLDNFPLNTLVKDQFGNYVVQRILDVATDDQLKKVVALLRQQIQSLKKYSYGKHIIAKLENIRA